MPELKPFRWEQQPIEDQKKMMERMNHHLEWLSFCYSQTGTPLPKVKIIHEPDREKENQV